MIRFLHSTHYTHQIKDFCAFLWFSLQFSLKAPYFVASCDVADVNLMWHCCYFSKYKYVSLCLYTVYPFISHELFTWTHIFECWLFAFLRENFVNGSLTFLACPRLSPPTSFRHTINAHKLMFNENVFIYTTTLTLTSLQSMIGMFYKKIKKCKYTVTLTCLTFIFCFTETSDVSRKITTKATQ